MPLDDAIKSLKAFADKVPAADRPARLGVVFAGGELSKKQKREIDQGSVNSERTVAVIAASVVDNAESAKAPGFDTVASPGVGAPAPELHPS